MNPPVLDDHSAVHDILRTVLGFKSFRPIQKAIINSMRYRWAFLEATNPAWVQD
jgi:hypothetical protein